MDLVDVIVLPYLLLLARIGAFFSVMPIFSWQSLPVRVRAGLAILVTAALAYVVPMKAFPGIHWLSAVLLLVEEMLTGAALGLAANLVYLAAGQAGRIIGLQAGLTDAAIIDPSTGEEEEPMGLFFDMAFAVLFLVAGGHHLLLMVIQKSYQAFPMGSGPDAGRMANGVIQAGSVMLLFALKLAAPVLAAFFVLSVVLAILARVMPEMNVLFTSLPLRMGLGLILAAAILPSLQAFVTELGDWMGRYLAAA